MPAQSRAAEEGEEDETEGAHYQLEMMRCLREVNVDNNTVGWCAGRRRARRLAAPDAGWPPVTGTRAPTWVRIRRWSLSTRS